jgi:hypothetical protein
MIGLACRPLGLSKPLARMMTAMMLLTDGKGKLDASRIEILPTYLPMHSHFGSMPIPTV